MMSILQSWPAFQTPRSVPPAVRREAVSSGMGFCLLISLSISAIAFLLSILIKWTGLTALSYFVSQVASLMFASFIGCIPCLLLAIPIASLALKLGYAGWVCALTCGGFLGHLFFTYTMGFNPEASPMGIGFGLSFSTLFWLGARLTTPAAFFDAGTQS